MPRTKEQFQQMQEASKAEILQAALELFAEKGFENTAISEIARRAGVSQGLMYNYFAGKDALLLAIFEKGWAEVQSSFVVKPHKGRKKASLYDFIAQACRATVEKRDFWRFVYIMRSQPLVLERLGVNILAFEQMILAQLAQFCAASPVSSNSPNESVVIADNNAQAEAHIIFALIDGICFHCLSSPQKYPLDEVLAFLKPLYDDRFLAE